MEDNSYSIKRQKITCPTEINLTFSYLKGIRRYQRGRQKWLIRKTDKTMANKMKRKTTVECLEILLEILTR